MSAAPVFGTTRFFMALQHGDRCQQCGDGGCLAQKGHPMVIISKDFGPRNQELLVYEKELLAITFVVPK